MVATYGHIMDMNFHHFEIIPSYSDYLHESGSFTVSDLDLYFTAHCQYDYVNIC